MAKWDKGYTPDYIIDFINKRVLKDIPKRNCDKITVRKIKRMIYGCLGLIQVRNGCRISESIRALHEYVKNNHKNGVVEILVSKKKKSVYRKVVIPFTLPRCWIEIIRNFLNSYDHDILRKNTIVFYSKLGLNTHNMRYAFVTLLSKKGYPPQIIARIIEHSNITVLERYIQKSEVDKILKEIDINIKW